LLVTQHYEPFSSTTSGYMADIAKNRRKNRVVVISSSPGCAFELPPTPDEPEVTEINSRWPEKSGSDASADCPMHIQAKGGSEQFNTRFSQNFHSFQSFARYIF